MNNMKNLGKWITNNTNRPFIARKEIEVTGPVKSAYALVTGLGQFNFFIDGKKVSDHVLDPGWTDYRKTVLYVDFDVTKEMTAGSHILEIEVGNGWFNWDTDFGYSFHFPEFMPPNPNPYRNFGEYLICNLKLDIDYEDGASEAVITDESWQVKQHKVKHTNVYGSELIEADCDEWKRAVQVTAENIPAGELTLQTQPAIKVIKSYKGKLISEIDGVRVYDLGQNISGLLRAKVKGKAGVKVSFKPAEKLDKKGLPDQMAKNWMMIGNVISYVIREDDAEESFSQTFTYFSGRYFAMEGDAEVIELFGDAISSAWKTDGTFSCDDERYNKIYDMIEKTAEANLLSVHTDCPTIERFAWQEPNHLMGAAIMYMKDGNKLWRKFLSDMRDGQHTGSDVFKDFEGKDFYPGDGLAPSQAPCYIPNVLPVPRMGSFYDIIPWGSSIILAARWHYLFYGDISIIEENYDAGMRYLEHLKTRMTSEGFINHGLGDWGNPEGELARENIETAFLYADAVTLKWFAGLLRKEKDARALGIFAEKVRSNYNEKLLIRNENGKYIYMQYDKRKEGNKTTQATQALPLYWGIVPDYAEADIADCLRENIESRGALVAGEVGLPYVIQAAAKYGMNDLISECIMKKEHPSYYAFILDGETTLGEYWESNPRSHCHDMMGHIIEWYYNGIAGIKPLEPGFKKVLIEPYLPESMNHIECTYNSVNGQIRVQLDRVGGEISVDVDVAEGIEYRIDRRFTG
jgi:hypothetical protein